ncbi:hypothetical protein KF913_03570 [Candidatus Obscuribacterales bacterium]|nr:hypothetical protein [Candidatus Obscuribacterales bacterium]
MGELFKRRIETELDPANIRIGEFLGLLEVLSPEVLDETLQVAQELEVPVGRATVLRGLITNGELSNLVQLHCLVRSKIIQLEDAKEAFFIARRENWNVREALVALGCAIDDGTIVRIGELLLESDRISENDLDTSLMLQGLCGLPIGRILTIDARIPEVVVSEALNLQTEIRERRSTFGDAVTRLKRLRVSKEDFLPRNRLLLNRHTAEAEVDEEFQLRDLLLTSNMVSEQDLKPAERFAESNNFLLEDVLRGFDFIQQPVLSAANGLTGFVRDGYLTGAEAVDILKALRAKQEKMDYVSSLLNKQSKDLTLYQFLVTSGFLTPDGLRSIIRTLMVEPHLFEEVLGVPRRSFSDKASVKRAIIKSILDSNNLEKSLAGIQQEDRRVVSYARDLLALISYGVVSVDQAILSFTRLRVEMGERPLKQL